MRTERPPPPPLPPQSSVLRGIHPAAMMNRDPEHMHMEPLSSSLRASTQRVGIIARLDLATRVQNPCTPMHTRRTPLYREMAPAAPDIAAFSEPEQANDLGQGRSCEDDLFPG